VLDSEMPPCRCSSNAWQPSNLPKVWGREESQVKNPFCRSSRSRALLAVYQGEDGKDEA
jgi:hypothetical protein